MARINSNVSAITAQRVLGGSYRELNETLEHLSTGLRVARGKDDPAGLIVSERLRSEIGAVNKAISNTQRAKTIISTTEGALDEVSALLRDIQGLITEAANRGALSDDEIRANQLQIDSSIASITRIASSTTFAGRALLNGSLDYRTSGIAPTAIDDIQIHGAQFGTRTSIPVKLTVVNSAGRAQLNYPFATVPQDVTIEISGADGVTTLSFAAGTSAAVVAEAIRSVSDATGISATTSAGGTGGFRMYSKEFGSRQFVAVRVIGTGTFATTAPDGTSDKDQFGRDVQTTVNGVTVIGDGLRLFHKTTQLDLEMLVRSTFLSTFTFNITGGGALFQVGPQVNSNLQVNVGVKSITASHLGNGQIGFLSQLLKGQTYSIEKGKFIEASRIVSESLRQVAVLRGRLGAFERNTLDTNINQLGITVENLMSAESAIRDADFAQETSELARRQVLVSSGTSVLQIANQTPQNVLRLLGG